MCRKTDRLQSIAIFPPLRAYAIRKAPVMGLIPAISIDHGRDGIRVAGLPANPHGA